MDKTSTIHGQNVQDFGQNVQDFGQNVHDLWTKRLELTVFLPLLGPGVEPRAAD